MISAMIIAVSLVSCRKEQQLESKFNPPVSGTTNPLTSVFFTDPATGYVAGVYGTILKTADSGKTWKELNSGVSEVLKSVFFTAPDTGYAVGWDATVLKTNDGGKNWISLTSGAKSTLLTAGLTYGLSSVFFTDKNTGYVTVGDGTGGIIKTTDGGTTWKSENCGSSMSLNSISCRNGTACAVGYEIITFSGDEGWTVRGKYTSTVRSLNSVFFTDANTGYAVGSNGTIEKTTDGGVTWTDEYSGTSDDLYSVFFTDPDTGYAAGGSYVTEQSGLDLISAPYSGTLLMTTDGGKSWSREAVGKFPLFSVFFINPESGFAVGDYGTIVRCSGVK